MGPSSLASIVRIAGFLTTLVAGMLWTRAWRGRITGWKSCCSRCGFEIRGLNPSVAACPECGTSLAAAAALRPAARQNEPWRWWVAVTATSVGVLLVWLGDVRQLNMTGRWVCSMLPDGTLVRCLDLMPQFASAELRRRIENDAIPRTETANLARQLAETVVAHPGMLPADAADALATLRAHGQIDAPTLTEVLRTTLAGVRPVAGQPNACKPGGTFALGVSLPQSQSAVWITARELQLAITGARLRMPDGSWRELETVSSRDRPGWQFDHVAFRAPDAPGTFDCEMRVTMQQPGGGFSADASAPFRLTVVDPSTLKFDFRSDSALAARVRDWLATASTELDADGTRLRVSIPGDVQTLQSRTTALGGLLLVVQDAVALEVGRVWIDTAVPTVMLTPAVMPPALDRTRGAALRLQPDPEFVMQMASSSAAVLRDQVEVPVKLPPPPPAPAPPPAEAPQPPASTGTP